MIESHERMKKGWLHLATRRLAWFTLVFCTVAGLTLLYAVEYFDGLGIPRFLTVIGELFFMSPFHDWIGGKLAGWLTWFMWSACLYAVSAWLRWPRWVFPVRMAKNVSGNS